MPRARKLPEIRHNLWLRASPAEVWKTLTNGKHLARWFTKGESIELKKGGRWDFVGFPGKVLQVKKCRVLSHTHTAPDKSVSRMTYRLDPSGKYTRLTMVHDCFGKSKSTRQCWEGGWPFLLSNLKTYIETGTPMWETPFSSSAD